MSAAPGQIFVVDDDADLVASVARMLRRQGFDATASSDPAGLIASGRVASPCCVVSDVMMGPLDGFAFARALRMSVPDAAFIFMTAWPRTRDAVAAIRDLDGIDYLEKPIDQDLLTATVRRGLAWSQARHSAARRLAPLSPRERQIFGLLVRGRTNKAIATSLNLSVKTVEDHRAAIMRKTQANSLAQLIDLATGDADVARPQ
jgi:two-component system, LuxR family, response regulator FixJ